MYGRQTLTKPVSSTSPVKLTGGGLKVMNKIRDLGVSSGDEVRVVLSLEYSYWLEDQMPAEASCL